MTRSPTYELVNDRLSGQLDEHLALWIDCRVSVPAMARLIERHTDVRVSAETVRRWLRHIACAA